MGPAGDICSRLSDLKGLRDLKDLKDPKDPKNLKFLLNRLLRAMWRPLRGAKRKFNHF